MMNLSMRPTRCEMALTEWTTDRFVLASENECWTSRVQGMARDNERLSKEKYASLKLAHSASCHGCGNVVIRNAVCSAAGACDKEALETNGGPGSHLIR